MISEKTAVEKVENYLIENDIRYEILGDGNIFHLFDEFEDAGDVLIFAEDPQLILRAEVTKIKNPSEKLFRRLLEFNNELAYGAFALEGDMLIWVDTLTSKTLDEEELLNSIEAFELAISSYYNEIKELL